MQLRTASLHKKKQTQLVSNKNQTAGRRQKKKSRRTAATSTRLYETAALKIKAAVSLRLHKPMTGTIYKSSCEGLGTDTYFYIKGIETA